VASKEIGVEVNADLNYVHGHVSRSECRMKSQYKDWNSSFERVEEFKYLERTLTNQNSFQEYIKSRVSHVMLLLFSPEYSVFQFAIQKYKD